MPDANETECPYPAVAIDGPDVIEGSKATYSSVEVGYRGQKPSVDWFVHDPDGLRYSPLDQEYATFEFDTEGTWAIVIRARYPSCPKEYWDVITRRVSVGATDVVDPKHRTPIEIRGPRTVDAGEQATFSVETNPNLAERTRIEDVYWTVSTFDDGERADVIRDRQRITVTGPEGIGGYISCNAKVRSTIEAGDTSHTWTAWRYDWVDF